jgi:hypothetical protein
VYPLCIGFRRLQEDDVGVDPKEMASSPQVRRALQSGGSAKSECAVKVQEVSATFDNAVATMSNVLSTNCLMTLSSPRHLVCVEFIDTDGDGKLDVAQAVKTDFPKISITNSVYIGTSCKGTPQKEVTGDYSTVITHCFRVCNSGSKSLFPSNDGFLFCHDRN